MNTPKFPLSLLLACAMLAGCAGQSPSWTAPDVVESTAPGAQAPIERDVGVDATATAPPGQTSAATLALLDSADQARQQNDHGAAINYLERAIRIEPRNAELWIRLSAAHLGHGNLAAASQHIRKAIALAGTDSQLKREAWLQLADIREAEGNAAEANAIRRRYAVAEG